MTSKIQMVDLQAQYLKIKDEIDATVLDTINAAWFIGGEKVASFKKNLEQYLGVHSVIPCGNGTDALQIALMALDLNEGDEIIVPAFTYAATAEVIALLKLKPVMVDVDPDTFNLTPGIVEAAITKNTKAIIPVHLFGQSTDMDPIMAIAKKYGLYVIEDNAQAIGADYTSINGKSKKTGTIGHIGTTSFFPSKNLGCFGDGGAITTNDEKLAIRLKAIANHGQFERYYHEMIGVNSRLDAIQAAVLDVKLKYLDDYAQARREVANYYDNAFSDLDEIQTPVRELKSTHVFHQYTIRIKNGKRNELQSYLNEKKIPANIYYPMPLYDQEAFKPYANALTHLPVTDLLCKEVLSLPIHTEMPKEHLEIITNAVRSFFGAKTNI